MNYYTKNISLNTYFLQPPRYVIGGISTNVENIESLSRFVKFDLNAGVSNSNPLTGHISYQKCSVGRTLKEKWLYGPHFLEEGSQGPHML